MNNQTKKRKFNSIYSDQGYTIQLPYPIQLKSESLIFEVLWIEYPLVMEYEDNQYQNFGDICIALNIESTEVDVYIRIHDHDENLNYPLLQCDLTDIDNSGQIRIKFDNDRLTESEEELAKDIDEIFNQDNYIDEFNFVESDVESNFKKKSCPKRRKNITKGNDQLIEKYRVNNIEELKFEGNIECNICLRDGKCLWDPIQNTYCSLCDVTISDLSINKKLADDIIFLNPCKNINHAICVGCFRHSILNRNNPPFNRKKNAILCINLNNHCPHSYEMNDLSILLEKYEYDSLLKLSKKHKFIDQEVIPCPLSMGLHDCTISYNHTEEIPIGKCFVNCNSSDHIDKSFCYHCGRPSDPLVYNRCNYCLRMNQDYRHPEQYNRYFYDPSKMGQLENNLFSESVLLKNKYITIDIAIEQIQEILEMDKIDQKCFVCGVPLQKSVDCNAILHCGIEKCHMCGMNSLLNKPIEHTHWNNSICSCPRYMTREFWAKFRIEYDCVVDECYSAEQECVLPEHQKELNRINIMRKTWHIWKMISSLDENKSRMIIDYLKEVTRPDEETKLIIINAIINCSFSEYIQ